MKIIFLIVCGLLIFIGIDELIKDTSNERGWLFILAGLVVFLVVYCPRLGFLFEFFDSDSDHSGSIFGGFDSGEGGSGCD